MSGEYPRLILTWKETATGLLMRSEIDYPAVADRVGSSSTKPKPPPEPEKHDDYQVAINDDYGSFLTM